ncbi:MAG: ethanolamine utilization protein EutN [Candidatus Latescibacteria bacterium]|nr:ethanolamine utilization protein EutN [Candidatus Latescibacterota bacterium]
MKICTVIGHVVAPSKHLALAGCKIMVVAPADEEAEGVQLAVDGVGAGIGSQVVVTESGAAGSRLTGLEHPPVRSVIVGIVDE